MRILVTAGAGCNALWRGLGLRRTWEWFGAHADPEHEPAGAAV